MDPKKTPPADQAKAPAVTPTELARTMLLFKWGLQEMRTLSQRIDVVEKTMRQLARDYVHYDAWQRLESDVARLREDVRRGQLTGEKNLISPAEKVGE